MFCAMRSLLRTDNVTDSSRLTTTILTTLYQVALPTGQQTHLRERRQRAARHALLVGVGVDLRIEPDTI